MRRGSWKIRIFIGLAIVAFAFIKRWSSKEENPYTGRVQTINMSTEQEIAIGLNSAPEIAQQYGGLYPDEKLQSYVDQIGHKLVQNSIARETPYKYDFHLLADDQTINAFALPGGPVFITYALFKQLNEAQLAGVLGHEIGHVIGRHSAERIAEGEFWQTLSTGASVGGDMGGLVGGIGQNTLLKNGRGDELESDDLGVLFMIKSGYRPEEMIKVMEILKAAAGPNRTPEFQSTHPDPENRIEKIQESIEKYRNQ
ncbi:M48 family metalloprotease [Zobellia galactanivorans]|uniref:Metallopeptidase, family M48 n=1 Tax=Zobellia galactanivorans (strain DSM 12802 / CCUG 47099 / CIP 106680 / NCIMB 13871 / Dsij) TaxID=63186 RepID=G0L1X7_ZOBGA|nr:MULTISPECIES: M48 family metalloprotease [Zobellia]MBU3027371.1 M48 family metalloprotease [Zobellia galactanivorans]MDO6809530.1 M48 family metalloprotease [Zobellia galactanivorans]OWW24414.1 peptidase M48 Ste24p [Zobellia sp. OII3]CAZ94802.1 Metallopeptidase, family M48 [Zobellia galactanivorans]